MLSKWCQDPSNSLAGGKCIQAEDNVRMLMHSGQQEHGKRDQSSKRVARKKADNGRQQMPAWSPATCSSPGKKCWS